MTAGHITTVGDTEMSHRHDADIIEAALGLPRFTVRAVERRTDGSYALGARRKRINWWCREHREYAPYPGVINDSSGAHMTGTAIPSLMKGKLWS